jgi:hypothetical protein
MGDDRDAIADLGVLLGRLAGDITKVAFTAGRQLLNAVVDNLPSLFGPISRFLDPILVHLTRQTGTEVFPAPLTPKLLGSASVLRP